MRFGNRFGNSLDRLEVYYSSSFLPEPKTLSMPFSAELDSCRDYSFRILPSLAYFALAVGHIPSAGDSELAYDGDGSQLVFLRN